MNRKNFLKASLSLLALPLLGLKKEEKKTNISESLHNSFENKFAYARGTITSNESTIQISADGGNTWEFIYDTDIIN